MKRTQLYSVALWLFAWRAACAGEEVFGVASLGMYGQEVISVGYTTDGPQISRPFLDLIEIRAGRPLTEVETSSTIRNLLGTRRFADVQIEATSTDGGVAVLVHFFRAYRVARIQFTGKVALAREQLRRALPFADGAEFLQEDVDEGAETLRRLFQQEGYLQARVMPGVSLDPLTFDATVTYRLVPGPHARTGPALFDGDTQPFSQEELLRRAKLKAGKPYSEAKARSSATRMADWLHKNSYL
ncbi:MAG TPA: POTRA domain-containing protein, partial [Thermoanaerobaculia bacterium]|nr:POTRA domain-containing protein [Thermoanaerobaculia bacterium]